MAWRLSAWLVLTRLFQLLGSFIPGAMNGWLLYYIYTNRLGLAGTMIALEALIAIIFVYTSISLLVIHTHRRWEKTAWIACSICFDIVFCLVALAIVSILSYTGVPANCSGLTMFKEGDKILPARGYSTIRFSNEQDGQRGELDKYCGMERAFYFIAIVIILSYIITIALSIIRICKLNLYSKGEVEGLLEERENMIKLELKVLDPETPVQSPTPLSSNATTAVPKDDVTNSRDLEAAYGTSAGTSRPRAMPSYSRPMLAVPTSSSAGPSSYHQHHQPPLHRPDLAVSPISPVSAVSEGVIPASPLSPAASTTLPVEAGFILSSTEIHANLAMITDGSRYSGPQQVVDGGGGGGGCHNQLPPYSPGNHRQMSGHGDESNEIRLSEYVKGATRAQDMKDEGGY